MKQTGVIQLIPYLGELHRVKDILVKYLCSILKVWMVEVTVNRLMLGCTLSSLSQCQPMVDDSINCCSNFIWRLLSSFSMNSSTSTTPTLRLPLSVAFSIAVVRDRFIVVLIGVIIVKHSGVWPGRMYFGQLAHVLSYWTAVFWNWKNVTLCQIVAS